VGSEGNVPCPTGHCGTTPCAICVQEFIRRTRQLIQNLCFDLEKASRNRILRRLFLQVKLSGSEFCSSRRKRRMGPLIDQREPFYFSPSNPSRHDSAKLRKGSIALAMIIGRRSANVLFVSGYDRTISCATFSASTIIFGDDNERIRLTKQVSGAGSRSDTRGQLQRVLPHALSAQAVSTRPVETERFSQTRCC